MARRGLEERIEAWPEQWKEARTRYIEAKGLVAKLQLQLDRAQERTQAREDTEIGEDSETTSTPALLAADQRLLDLDFEIQRATFAIERAKAEADVRTRNTAHAEGQKLTEAAVDARVKSDSAYIASQENLLQLKHQHALAKLERNQQWQLEREQRRSFVIGTGEVALEPENEEIRQLRDDLAIAYAHLETARTNLGHQQRVGQTLQMLVEVLKADSVVAAAVPIHGH